jgi:hypothetical protein
MSTIVCCTFSSPRLEGDNLRERSAGQLAADTPAAWQANDRTRVWSRPAKAPMRCSFMMHWTQLIPRQWFHPPSAASLFGRYHTLASDCIDHLTSCVRSSLARHKATVNNPVDSPRKVPATTSLRK